jgi:hypothetical protein
MEHLMSRLTFNLALTEKQRHAKSNLELPYLRVQGNVKNNDHEKSQIVYHPEEIEEEDPDADLDI